MEFFFQLIGITTIDLVDYPAANPPASHMKEGGQTIYNRRRSHGSLKRLVLISIYDKTNGRHVSSICVGAGFVRSSPKQSRLVNFSLPGVGLADTAWRIGCVRRAWGRGVNGQSWCRRRWTVLHCMSMSPPTSRDR